MAPFKGKASRTDDTWVHDRAPGLRGPRPRSTLPPPSTTSKGGLSSKILVTNLHYEISQKDLTAIFGQMGTLVREPLIRFDRSGRSEGKAIVTFETPAEATRAKKQLNGVLAKGQPMEIEFEAESIPRRAAAAPSSLLDRMQKAPLIARLGQAESAAKASLLASTKKGEVSRGRGRGRGRGGAVRGGAERRAKPKTAQELDGELDAFMSVDNTPATNSPMVVE
ncbi:hypothetical protein BV25DRAFT_978406 [Artomyces pyxidatus]|uniref:Uncharacterized protein n=1 Tax=Artomyces pyxidatus TaxID=48021 RepID=A0ACB8SW57_9AGAM|nr:hypothetical protein BV25DRAFT_978406 [Artomyces pyxidatus]